MKTHTPPDFPDAFRLDGKNVLVTGASSGIGQAAAVLCAQLGARVILNGREAQRLQSVLSSLTGNCHEAIVADLTDSVSRSTLAERIETLDGFVSCAGAVQLAPMQMLSEQHLQRMLAINFEAPMLLTQRLLFKKKIRPHASLVYITARTEHLALPATSIYSAAKAALTTAVRTLALEQAKKGIRANCVSPGFVETPMLEQLRQSGADPGKECLERTPLGVIEPEDVANGIAYLLCPASRWVSRTSLTIDGGLSLHVR